eukprot:11158100-Alexandrium_andersonii.AAC.1
MSASLVGSEMCIRDRLRSLRPEPPGKVSGSSPEVLHRLPGGSREGLRRPVSYTHLTLPTICSV